jgi:flagellar motor switch protein FliM
MGGEDLDLELCFCLPYAGLEPIIDQLSTQEYFNRSLRQSYRDRTFAKRLPEIPVEVSARLATIEMSYQDVEAIDVGSVLQLPRSARDRVAVYVDGEHVFTAKPHVSSVDSRYLFRIEQVLAPGIEKTLAATEEKA